MTLQFIVLPEPGLIATGAYLYEVIDDSPAYKRIAHGSLAELTRVAKLLNGIEPATELVAPEKIQIGDQVLVKLVVSKFDNKYRHIYATGGPQTSPWQLGDQEMWTWAWSGVNEPAKIERIKQ